MGCKRPKGARSEPKASEARAPAKAGPKGARSEPKASEARAPAKAGTQGRRFAFLALACFAAAAALPAVPALGQQGREVPTGQPDAVREPRDASPRLASVEGEVREADELVRGARFEEALTRIESIRRELAALQGDAARRLRARTEVMAATAYVALDREDAARECFRRALAAEPALDLDAATTAPKVLRVFRSVREEPRVAR